MKPASVYLCRQCGYDLTGLPPTTACPECGHEGGWRCVVMPPLEDTINQEQASAIRRLALIVFFAGVAPISFAFIALCIHIVTLVLDHNGFSRPQELWTRLQDVASIGFVAVGVYLAVLVVYLANGSRLLSRIWTICHGESKRIKGWLIFFTLTGIVLWSWVAVREFGLHSRISTKLAPLLTGAVGLVLIVHSISSWRTFICVISHGPQAMMKYRKFVSCLVLISVFFAFAPFFSDLIISLNATAPLSPGGDLGQTAAINLVFALSASCMWLTYRSIENGRIARVASSGSSGRAKGVDE